MTAFKNSFKEDEIISELQKTCIVDIPNMIIQEKMAISSCIGNYLIRRGWNIIEFRHPVQRYMGAKKESYFTEEELFKYSTTQSFKDLLYYT